MIWLLEPGALVSESGWQAPNAFQLIPASTGVKKSPDKNQPTRLFCGRLISLTGKNRLLDNNRPTLPVVEVVITTSEHALCTSTVPMHRCARLPKRESREKDGNTSRSTFSCMYTHTPFVCSCFLLYTGAAHCLHRKGNRKSLKTSRCTPASLSYNVFARSKREREYHGAQVVRDVRAASTITCSLCGC